MVQYIFTAAHAIWLFNKIWISVFYWCWNCEDNAVDIDIKKINHILQDIQELYLIFENTF